MTSSIEPTLLKRLQAVRMKDQRRKQHEEECKRQAYQQRLQLAQDFSYMSDVESIYQEGQSKGDLPQLAPFQQSQRERSRANSSHNQLSVDSEYMMPELDSSVVPSAHGKASQAAETDTIPSEENDLSRSLWFRGSRGDDTYMSADVAPPPPRRAQHHQAPKQPYIRKITREGRTEPELVMVQPSRRGKMVKFEKIPWP